MSSIIENQVYLFMIFVLNGIVIGIIFDVFRILRKSFKTPNFVTDIEDILFWICATLIVLYSLFVFNNGEIRGYIFIGLFLGLAIYMLLFSKFVVKVSVKIIEVLTKILGEVFKFISYPVKIIIRFITKIFIIPINFTKKHLVFKNLHKNNEKLENKEGF